MILSILNCMTSTKQISLAVTSRRLLPFSFHHRWRPVQPLPLSPPFPLFTSSPPLVSPPLPPRGKNTFARKESANYSYPSSWAISSLCYPSSVHSTYSFNWIRKQTPLVREWPPFFFCIFPFSFFFPYYFLWLQGLYLFSSIHSNAHCFSLFFVLSLSHFLKLDFFFFFF